MSGSTEAPIKADQVIPVLLLTEEELNGTPEQIGQLLQYYVDTDDKTPKSKMTTTSSPQAPTSSAAQTSTKPTAYTPTPKTPSSTA
ncbi:hypothetical protein N0V85_009334 [Neurospora sp. IMI 360204]|nr:hypothetical protein N0V85_009334 [Neurospora sp. IMI 360204]